MNNKYDDVGLEAGRLPEDLKNYGRRFDDRDELFGAFVGVAAACLFIGYAIGLLSR